MVKRMGGDFFYYPEFQEPDDNWTCQACEAQNSYYDGECQFCECGGLGECKRGNCSDIRHFHGGSALQAARLNQTRAWVISVFGSLDIAAVVASHRRYKT